jgi:hypothetical protein
MWQLQQRQQMPLELKEKLSLERIKDFYEFFNGKVYVSFIPYTYNWKQNKLSDVI